MSSSNVSIEQLKEFLTALNGRQRSTPDDFIEVWELFIQEGSPIELVLPTEAAVDGAYLVSSALQKLAETLDQQVGAVVDQIREHSESHLHIRVVHPDVQNGSIPLEDGILLNANAKELLIAAANATLERRSLYQGRMPLPVASLIQNARLGQTTHGSYVIRVFCPDFDGGDGLTSFSQATTQMLESALSGLQEAITQYRESSSPIVFEGALNCGASANLCEAIANLSGKNRERAVQIAVRPRSAGRLVPSDRRVFDFSIEDQSEIRIAAEYYRQIYTLSNELVTGVVERLDRRAEREEGTVRISAMLSSGVRRNVSVQLSPEEYQEAIRAHEEKLTVRVIGDVVVSPRGANIIGARDFAVVRNDGLFNT
jgi:hypothetical protein